MFLYFKYLKSLFHLKFGKIVESRDFFRYEKMPSEETLNNYYKYNYFAKFKDSFKKNIFRDALVTKRDYEHLQIILKHTGNYKIKSMLNFGPGHGGINWLLEGNDTKIYSIEKYPDQYLKEKFKNYLSINEVNKKFNLVYSSHSLEHIIEDPYLFVEKLTKLILNNGFLFFEIPMVKKPNRLSGHTYYYKDSFFKSEVFDSNFKLIFLNKIKISKDKYKLQILFKKR